MIFWLPDIFFTLLFFSAGPAGCSDVFFFLPDCFSGCPVVFFFLAALPCRFFFFLVALNFFFFSLPAFLLVFMTFFFSGCPAQTDNFLAALTFFFGRSSCLVQSNQTKILPCNKKETARHPENKLSGQSKKKN
jgi:hypothetical protein